MKFSRRITRAGLLGCIGLSVVACRDSAGPDDGIRVAIELEKVSGPTIYADSVGDATVFCSVDIRAIARGTGSATWLDATTRWYFGRDRQTATDSSSVDASAIQRAWGQPGIAGGDTLLTVWEFTAYVPFAASIEYRYRAVKGGEVRSSTVPFKCGDDFSAGVNLPAVTSIVASGGPGDFEPGDFLQVTYTASAEAKLFRTLVRLGGPCALEQRISENLAASATRTVTFQIPAECRLGMPFTVSVVAFDAALQSVSRQQLTGLVLVDRTPPTIQPRFVPRQGGSATTDVTGLYFGGDSIQMNVTASDNHGLNALIWEVMPFGVRDSLIVTTPTVDATVYIRLRPEWSGPIELRVYARDQVGLSSAVVTPATSGVRLLPSVQRTSASATITGATDAVLLDSRRGVIYLLQSIMRRIAVVQLATLQLSASVPLPSSATSFDLSAGGDSLIVALTSEGALGIVDLRPSTLSMSYLRLTAVDPTADQRPSNIRVAANGRALVSLRGQGPPDWTMIDVDFRSGTQRRRTDAGIGGVVGAGLLGASIDREIVAVMTGRDCLQRYVSSTDAFGPCRSVANGPAPSVDATGQRTAVGLDVFDASMQLLRRVENPPNGSWAISTVLSPDGAYLYEIMPGYGVVRARVSDGQIVDRTLVPMKPDFGTVSADGAVLVVVQSVLNTSTTIGTINMR